MVPDNSSGMSRVPAYSGADLFRGSFRVRGSHPLWRAAPCASTRILGPLCRSYNPGTCLATPPVWAPPRSLAATWGIVFTFFSSRYLDVSVHAVPSFVLSLQLSGLLHSEISGSTFDCNYPELIAAYHVLHRLLLPRHSLCALNYFNL